MSLRGLPILVRTADCFKRVNDWIYCAFTLHNMLIELKDEWRGHVEDGRAETLKRACRGVSVEDKELGRVLREEKKRAVLNRFYSHY
jgi:hypothetical protein